MRRSVAIIRPWLHRLCGRAEPPGILALTLATLCDHEANLLTGRLLRLITFIRLFARSLPSYMPLLEGRMPALVRMLLSSGGARDLMSMAATPRSAAFDEAPFAPISFTVWLTIHRRAST